ncbi:hypothetical protein SAMN04487983_107713 [Streptomyces sp. yr375]|uniref:hypothetical protein n=1 Tax=Streptomyces sp. yr375 TaxID=1761906 RepID=UPI0008B9DF05|nr:hypothetical protein [Streptomyces sp. yr375]SES49255.1 hypothetical protein SAMN04487983_107713 [Streptomyces sp. yr375]
MALLDYHAESSPYGRFQGDVVLLLGKWATGEETNQLGTFARELDSRSGGALGLEEFIGTPCTGPASGGQHGGRWWRG